MGKCWVLVFLIIVLLGIFAPTPAKATSIDTFVFQTCEPQPSGCNSGTGPFNNTYTWQAPTSPTPTNFCQNSFIPIYCFSITADVTANGTNFGVTTVRFGYNESNYGGGFDILALNLFGSRPAVWAGASSSPTLIPGSYVMYASDLASPEVGILTIADPPGPPDPTSVPEPSTLLLTGAGLFGFAVIASARKQFASAIIR